MAKWDFERQSPATRRSPNETQLFKTEQAEEDEYAGTDALVREVLQNSMDAAIGDGPVRMRIALHSHDDLPDRDRLRHYFSRLQAPIEQLEDREIVYGDGIPQLQEGFLVCEDFGTRGLCGDPMLERDPATNSSERQDFFWFWRNIGRSGKTGDDLGRWGLGKTVYRAASQLGCMLGLTVRVEDKRELLMGQAVLQIHEFQGVEFAPEGYWCERTNDSGLPLPIDATDDLQRFRSEWKLQRKPGEPGLSVVVPYVAPELKGENILQAICVNFFLPILRGRLIVDFVAPDTRDVHLDQNSLLEWCDELRWDGPKRTKRHQAPPIEFVKRCISAEESVTSSEILGQSRLPELNEASFDEQTLTRLRNEFADEKLVALRLQFALPKRQGSPEEGELIVFVQRQPDGAPTDTYYVREGMTITKPNSKAAKRGIRAFVTVDQYRLGTTERNPLASLLGDSEGPAHNDWDTSEERPNRTWKTWKGRVKFCRKIVDHLVTLLAPPTNKADFDLLSEVFSIEKIQAKQRSKRPNEDGAGTPDFGAITPTARWFRVDGRPGGFRIVSNGNAAVPTDARIKVSVAYDLPNGSPVKRWSPFDFDFRQPDDITLRGKNVSPKTLDGNVLLLKIKGDTFRFSADGFDEHRDLLVRAEEEEAGENMEHEHDD